MQPKKRITLKELTGITGLSRTTIYNVLNNKGNFTAETRRTVLEAMERYDYRPNLNARNLALRREYIIAYVGISSEETPYCNRDVQQGLARALHEYEDDGLCLINKTCSVHDQMAFYDTVLQLEQSGIKHYILFPVNTPYMRDLAQGLIDRGCTVVLLSNQLAVEGALAYSGCDYFQSGQICGQLVQKMSPKPANIQLVLNRVGKTDAATLERLRGFEEYISQFDHLHLCEPFYVNETEPSVENLSRLFTEHHVDTVVDIIGALEQAARALETTGTAQDTTLIGFDLYDEVVPYLQRNTIDVLIEQGLAYQAWDAVRMMFDYLCYNKKPNEFENYASLHVILSSNLRYFQNRKW